MKKLCSATLCLLLLFALLTGCQSPSQNNGKLNIVVTTFPEYDWVRQIMGEKKKDADLTLLLDNGVDLHSYQPTTDDIVKISSCDMFIYVGGESDKWVDDALKETTNPDMITLNLLASLKEAVKEEEVVEGMQAEEEEEDSEEGEEPEYDEHVWLSLKNTAKLCKVISRKLGKIDKDNKETYLKNADAYIEKLNALDQQYEEAVRAANTKTLLFGDRFPFRYLTDDYGLQYYAAFVGCSAETEASFETIRFLAKKVDELGLKVIMQTESSDGKIAQTIQKQSKAHDQTVLTLDSMQSKTSSDLKNGTTYLSVMEKNLEVLKKALK